MSQIVLHVWWKHLGEKISNDTSIARKYLYVLEDTASDDTHRRQVLLGYTHEVRSARTHLEDTKVGAKIIEEKTQDDTSREAAIPVLHTPRGPPRGQT